MIYLDVFISDKIKVLPITKSNMSRLELFPLNIVAFPTKIIPLHIFEERYKSLISESISQGKDFGIIFKDKDGLANYGCSTTVLEIVKKYSDGRMDIVAKGNKIFKLTSKLMEDDILVGNVEFIDSDLNSSAEGFEKLKDKYLKLLLTIGITSNLDKDIVKSFSFELLDGISLPSEFELSLISTSSEEERIKLLNRIFDKILTNKFIKSLTKKEKV
ncbi:MAG: LON peptidase substrate-binding domain-containing protein [Fidelibacterota bacterium]